MSEVYVVVSKMKQFFKAKGMNTSASASTAMSSKMEMMMQKASEKAAKDGRKTVMDRDFDSDEE